MFKMIKQKMKNKLWLTACLILGMAFLVAVLVCQPMFKQGALNILIRTSFDNYAEDNNEYPAVIGREATIKGAESLDVIIDEIENSKSTWFKYLEGIDAEAVQTRIRINEMRATGSFNADVKHLYISYMPEFGEHITILDGQFYDSESDSAPNAESMDEGAAVMVKDAINEGAYPCIINQKIMNERRYVVGELLTFANCTNDKGEPLKLVVAGIYKEKDIYDNFWYIEPYDFANELFVSKEAETDILANYSCDSIDYSNYIMLDYEDIDSENIEDIKYYIEKLAEYDDKFVYTFSAMLSEYGSHKKTIETLLWVLQLPIFGMVLAFLYMVSSQIVESEKNEIAIQRSRGLGRLQIIAGYAMECGILSVYGLILGLPLGYGLCKLCAMTTDFLTFDGMSAYLYKFTWGMLVYGAAAVFVGTIFIIMPVVGYSKITIVEHKNLHSTNKKPFWEKAFLDVILVGVALYLLRNFNIQKNELRLDVMAGKKMDPLIFLDSTLFIIGFGLLFLRLSHYLVRLVYRIGKNKWRPAMYASFLQITRTFGRQGFISVFMILTVAMGLFNANTARTINQNNGDRIEYENGADAVVCERWVRKTFEKGDSRDYKYEEPVFARFEELCENEYIEQVTRVLFMDGTKVSNASMSGEALLMGINSKEFGEIANFKDELNKDVHWYTYLNELAKNPDGVIISSNLAKDFGYKIGDSISTSRMGDTDEFKNKPRGSMDGRICAIVDDWPGYNRYYYEEGEEKERYLIVANYPKVVNAYQVAPYEVWIKLSKDIDKDKLEDILSEKGIVPDEIKLLSEDIYNMKQEPLIQITNGMFTLTFIIALVLCALGFLIYWITSIRQRELLFGVYRAMGLPVKELNAMLTNEHIFSTFLSVIIGGAVGMVSTLLFVKLFGIVYLPEKHNLDIYVYFHAGDIIKLAAVLVIMIIICMLVLRRIIKTMNITKALKLGEE